MNAIMTLLPGLGTSLQLLLAALAVGLPLGILCGLGLASRAAWLRWLLLVLTEIGRGFPALVTLYLVYFGLPSVGVVLEAFPALVVAFGYTTASYTADIFRAAILAVPHALTEAGEALGLSRFKILVLVVLPLALRSVVAPVLGFSIIVFHGTALAYSIGLRELISRAYDQGSLEFNALKYLMLAAAMYLVVSVALGSMAKLISSRSASQSRKRIPRQEVPTKPKLTLG